MGRSLRPRRPAVRRALGLELGLLVIALLPAMAAGGCGRIGYEALPESAGFPDGGHGRQEASISTDTGADAPETAVAEASEDSASDATAESDGDAACVPSADVDYCHVIPPLPSAPVIDGVLDCGPTLAPIVPELWRGAAPLPPFPAGNSAQVAAAWRPDGLYIFIAVTTPVAIPADPASPAYFGAGVELFVDHDGTFPSAPAYDNPGTMQMIVLSPPYATADASADTCPDASADASTDASGEAGADASADASGEAGADASADASGEAGADASAEASIDAPPMNRLAELYRNGMDLGPWTSTRFGTFPTPDGFVFEGFVGASDLGLPSWGLSSGGMVGFDVAVDVSFPTLCTTGLEGHRAGQYFFYVSTTPPDAAADAGPIQPPYLDTRSFCTPTLAPM